MNSLGSITPNKKFYITKQKHLLIINCIKIINIISTQFKYGIFRRRPGDVQV
jgi:hypothetical protein